MNTEYFSFLIFLSFKCLWLQSALGQPQARLQHREREGVRSRDGLFLLHSLAASELQILWCREMFCQSSHTKWSFRSLFKIVKLKAKDCHSWAVRGKPFLWCRQALLLNLQHCSFGLNPKWRCVFLSHQALDSPGTAGKCWPLPSKASWCTSMIATDVALLPAKRLLYHFKTVISVKLLFWNALIIVIDCESVLISSPTLRICKPTGSSSCWKKELAFQ